MSSNRLTSEKRRACILEAAIRLFSEKGFRGATTRELASKVGVSEPVLYQHFSNKRDLYIALLEQLADSGVKEALMASWSDSAIGDERASLTQLANGIIDWHLEQPPRIRILILSALENHEFSELFYQRYSKVFIEKVTRFFDLRIRSAVFKSMDPRVMANAFVAMVANYAIQLTIFPEEHFELPRPQIVEGFVDIFLEGVKQREPHN